MEDEPFKVVNIPTSSTQQKKHQCDVCDKHFSYPSDLITHMRVHSGEKPYTCSQCGKEFALKGNMVKHMRTHTGERFFSCTFCPYTSAHKQNLTQHIRTHTGEKPFSCDVCGKSFAQRGSLKRHAVTHTGHFEKSLGQMSDLTNERKKQTQENMFKYQNRKMNTTNRESSLISRFGAYTV